MGSGSSTLNSLVRLRKALVIRAYNLRSPDETLEDQFSKYVFRKDDIIYISLDDVKGLLSDGAPWIEDLFRQLLGVSNSIDLEFKDFLDFVETGKSPSGMSLSLSGDVCEYRAPATAPLQPSRPNAEAKAPLSIKAPTLSSSASAPGIGATKGFPPSPPRQAAQHPPASGYTLRDSGMYAEVADCLLFRLAVAERLALVRTVPKPAGQSVKPLWRKREVVRQERSVYYTTVGADGSLQELVEKETTQTEVLHMECKETGEFAHRETTQYEQLETFNDEVVVSESGKEEYVHLKSVDDEIEYMDSSMPRGRSSRPAGDGGEEGREAGGEEGREGRGEGAEPSAGSPQPPAPEPMFEEGRDMTEEEMQEYEEAVREQMERELEMMRERDLLAECAAVASSPSVNTGDEEEAAEVLCGTYTDADID